MNVEYSLHNDEENDETIHLGIGMKGLWGEIQESAFIAYVKDIRQVEENLLTYFSIGLEYTDSQNTYFTSLGVTYQEEDWQLQAETKYQWNNDISQWTVGIEGKYRLDQNAYVVIGYRDSLSGTPAEPFEDFDFQGLYM